MRVKITIDILASFERLGKIDSIDYENDLRDSMLLHVNHLYNTNTNKFYINAQKGR